jgi:RNA polymerase sigma factor (sigma-70 family)
VGEGFNDQSRSDADILDAVRRGDRHAYVELYQRYLGAARRLARSLLRNQADADDVVSEVFASVFSVIQRGKGPRDGFAAYLMASVRNECYRAQRQLGRTTQVAPTDDELVAEGDNGVELDPFARRDEADVVQQALQTLPSQFREVLWRTEVEGQSHQEIAESIGTTPQAVAAQAMRARRALGGAYLRGHVAVAEAGESTSVACADARHHLADLVRDSLSPRGRRRLEAHLATCEPCCDTRDELERLNQHLRTAPGLPLAAGAEVLRVGLKARLLGWLAVSSPSLVAATGLVVVSGVVPLVVANRSSGAERVATVVEAPARDEASGAATTADEPATSVVRTDDSDQRREPAARDKPRAAPPAESRPRRRPEPDRRADRRQTPVRSTPTVTTAPPDTAPPATAPRATAPPATAPATAPAPVPESTPPVTVVPGIETPAVTVTPRVSVPAVSTPAIELPEVTTPPVNVPSVSLPLVTTPPITVPSVSVPSVTVPSVSVPSITVPPITVPSVSVPPVTLPPITLPPIGG